MNGHSGSKFLIEEEMKVGSKLSKHLFMISVAFLLIPAMLIGGCGRKEEVIIEEEVVEEVVDENAPEVVPEKIEEEVPQELAPKAPNFNLTRLNGRLLRLSQVEAKAIIVNFWLTRSKESQEQIPDLVRLYEEYNGRGLEIIGISLDHGRSDEVKEFAHTNGIKYPICIDDYRVFEEYQPGGLPATVIMNEDFSIVEKFPGRVSYADLESQIKNLIKE